MKPVDVKSSTYIDSNKEVNDMMKILNQQLVILLDAVFPRRYVPNWSEEVFVIRKFKNIEPQTYVISDRKGEKNVGKFQERKLQKANQKKFRFKKLISR